ncbi:S8 family serine peptidase [Crocinitomicaceae bacterium]|nr:S8 family serine peptidase [Crocinitomicaceae bacterium]
MMKLAILVATFFVAASLFAQENSRNYLVHAGKGASVLSGDLRSNVADFSADASTHFDGKAYVLVQFNGIPTDEQKEAYAFYGCELIKYIPNYAWIAKVDTNISQNVLSALNVRHIMAVPLEWKMSNEMMSAVVPEHAGNVDDVRVNVLFWEQPSNRSFEDLLSDFEVEIEVVNNERAAVSLSSGLENLMQLAEHPLVQYIEFTEAPIEFEGIKEESERIISTYISNNPGKGYYFDGSGVNIAVDEGGILDTLENPNYRTRIDRTYENGTTVGGHKTSVSARMAKAGNIDPREQGTAFGATLFSGGVGTSQAATSDIVITNRSYGWGCPSSTETYNSGSYNYDYDVRNNPQWIITHSAGNAGGSNCYVGTAGWGNITGMPKMAKNIFAVGSSNNDGVLTGFSSRGPAKDGRILPHIVSPGPGGTSHASPNLAGVFGQLNQAYRYYNSNITPQSGLLKAIIMNTADDMQNPGPDFQTGFGHVNARRAFEVVRLGQHANNFVSQGSSQQHSITVPANVKELKVMVYWVDWEATAGITTRSLVNDLDIVLQDPTATNYQPWVLNPTFDPILLDQNAVRATDTLNNHEQITIDEPIAGNYQLTVTGTMVPQGPQLYFMTYEFVMDDIVVTHPHGGEKFVPGETERLRWDAFDSTLTFDISYSNDGGTSWSSIASGVGQDSRYYDWTVPQNLTDQAMIRVERGTTAGESDAHFSISELPQDLELVWSCADSSLFAWDNFLNADGYTVYRIVGDYMDSVAYTTNTSMVLNGLSLIESEYVSIAVVQNGVTSRRVIAIEREPTYLNCNMNDLGTLEILSPGAESLPDCMASALNVEIKVRNWGVNAVDSIPVAYRINGGPIAQEVIYATIPSGGEYDVQFSSSTSFNLGGNSIEAWTEFSGDAIVMNDTISDSVWVYASSSSGPNITEIFDNFTNCSTAWDCELVDCAMQNGWHNVSNGSGDDIDWRTHSGATGSGNTGPSADHTTGNGKYLYLEGSGPCVNVTARLHSPCIDLSGINQAEMTFWYHAYGAAIGELHVDVIADGALIEDAMTPVIGEQGDLWIQASVDLSPFSNQQIVVIIRGVMGGTWTSDWGIDDINISVAPIASYTASETQVCPNETVTMTNNSLYGFAYDWSFQSNTVTYVNGTNSSSSNPQVDFNAPGWYTVQLIASNGAGDDTLTNVDYIYVWEDQPSLNPIEICEGDSVILTSNNNGQTADYYLNGSNVYSGTDPSYYFANAVAGDEIYVVYDINGLCTLTSDTVIVNSFDVETGIAQNGLQIDAVASNAQYQWLDCLNGYSPIAGEVNQSFVPINDGEYAVQVTENGCIDTSACLVFNTTSLNEVVLENILCFPNPTTDEVTVQFDQVKTFVTIEIYSTLGQELQSQKFVNTSEETLALPDEPAVYVLKVTTDLGSSILRVVKK